MIDGIQVGFVWTSCLPSGWHRDQLFPSIPMVLKLEHVSGLTGELGKRHCLPHPTVSDAVNPGLGLKNLHLQCFQGDLLLLVWDHTWKTSANKPGSI